MLQIWHVTILEAIWTVIGMVGCYFGISNLQYSKKDIEALKAMNGGNYANHRIMRMLAFGHYRNNLFRLAKHTVVLSIGVISDLLPSPHQNRVIITPSSIVVTLGLLFIVVLLVMASVLDRRQREAIEQAEVKQYGH